MSYQATGHLGRRRRQHRTGAGGSAAGPAPARPPRPSPPPALTSTLADRPLCRNPGRAAALPGQRTRLLGVRFRAVLARLASPGHLVISSAREGLPQRFQRFGRSWAEFTSTHVDILRQ